jgi:hypothetical protein
MKWHVIRDIRCYMEDVTVPEPSFTVDLARICQRYWGKLRELGFQTPGYHHVYLTLSANRASSDVNIVPFLEWCANIKLGFPSIGDDTSENEKHDLLVRFVAKAFKQLCKRDSLDYPKVEKTKKLLLTYRTELESVHLLKETGGYRVTISFQVCPHGGPSLAFVGYNDKKAERIGKKILTELTLYEDLHWIASSIVVKNGVVEIRPRTSRKARFWSRLYKVPFKIQITDLLRSAP